jgi:molecular chaperone GrpE (heat shock protein)
MVEEAEVPENHVAEQLQAGYLLYDRVLRPSMVRVSGKA